MKILNFTFFSSSKVGRMYHHVKNITQMWKLQIKLCENVDFTCDKVNFTWFYVQCFFSAWGNSNSHVNIFISYVAIFSYMWKTHLWKRPVHMWHHQTLAKKMCFTWKKKPNARENVKFTCDEANFTWFYVPCFVFTCGKSQSHLKHVNIFILIWKRPKHPWKLQVHMWKTFAVMLE